LGGTVEIYPYEPVVVSVPHQSAHLNAGYATNAVILCPNAAQITNQVYAGHFFGVTNGRSLFLLSAWEPNVFTTLGGYTVVLENVTNTVSVLAPAAQDATVVPLLDNMTLPRIVLNCGRADLDAGLKTVCQQIVARSPNGRYAPYADAYLAIDGFYSSMETLAETGQVPDFSALGAGLASHAVPANLAKWTVLYNKGCVYQVRRDKPNAVTTFTSLTNGIQYSVWTRNATMILGDIP
jgi:hypothetical protein